MKRKAHYPVTQTQFKTLPKLLGPSKSIDNAFFGPIPERIVLAFVKTPLSLVLPVRIHSTFFVMIYLVFCVNGVQHPSEPQNALILTLWCYQHLRNTISSMSIHHDDRAHITLEIFTKGFYVLGFDLTTDRGAEDHNSARQSNVRIEALFKTPLPEPVTCIFMLNSPDTSKLTNPETSH